MMKRIIALLLALILTVGLLPTVALAAEGETGAATAPADVIDGYYDDNNEWTKGKLPQSTVPGVQAVSKTAKPTSNPNEYEVELEVVLQQTEENSGKAATVLVLDTSGSMAYCAECGAEDDCVHNYVKFNGTPNSKGQYYYKTTDKNGKEKFERAYYCDRKHIVPNKKHTAGWFTTSGDSIWHDPRTDSLAGQTIYVKSATPRTSRLDAAKVAAENFLKTYSGLTFKTDGTPADNQNNRNLGRYVSVVSFATKAEPVQSWVDVSNSDVYKEVLKNIKRLNAKGGTNLDAGLTYAEYLLKQTTVNDAVKNVIALTDGQPTFFIDTNEKAYKDDGLTGLDREFLTIDNTTYRVHGTGDSCNEKTFTETVASADTVKNRAKLYTVCFDADETIDVPNNGGQISVSKYLSTKIATQPTKTGEQFAYDADNAEKLYVEFAKITQSIVSGLNNGTVRDTLPTGITSAAFDEGNVKEWKLNEAPFTKNETPNTVGGKQVTTYTYTYTYTVTIDPKTVKTEKVDGVDYAPLNGETTLTVKNSQGTDVEIPFPIPAGKVTMPSYTVTYTDGVDSEVVFENVEKTAAYKAAIPAYGDSNPTRTGYTFTSWKWYNATDTTYANEITPAPTTMPAYNLVAVAQWTPATDTTYIVEHYLQDLTGDGYAKQETETKAGTTGATATAEAKTYTGFMFDENNASNVKSGTIAADGSLVLKLYYTRNSYKVTYDYGTAPSGASTLPTEATYKYGATVTVAAKATAPGYNFDGWKKDGNVTTSFEMPADNVTLTGTWTAKSDTAYQVKHYLQNLTDDGYTLAETETKSGTTGAQTEAVAKSYTGFTVQPFNQKTIAADGTTVVEIHYNRNTYKVTYDYGTAPAGASTLPTEATYKYGAMVTVAAKATAPGYDFDGWKKDGTVTTSFVMPAQNVTLTGSWTQTTANVNFNGYIKKCLEVAEGSTLPENYEETFNFIVFIDGNEQNFVTGSVTMDAAETSNVTFSGTTPLTVGPHTFTVKETAPTNGTFGMTYDTTVKNFALMVNADGTYTFGHVNGSNEFAPAGDEEPKFVTITNTYTQPTETFDLNTLITKNFEARTDSKPIPNGNYTFTAQIFEADEQWQQVGETPAYIGTATLNGAASGAAFDFGSSRNPTLASGTHRYLVKEEHGGETINGITYDSTVYRLTITVSEDGTQPNVQIEAEPQASVLSVQSVEFTSKIIFTNTYFEEKDPNALYLDFSKYVQKELTATGSKTASDVKFRVIVNGMESPIMMYNAGEEEVSTYVEFNPRYSTVLNVNFASITGGNTETKDFTGSYVEIDQVGIYYFELNEEDGKRTGVTYDDSTYKVYVYVKREGDKLVVGSFDIYKDGCSVAGETITFHNTIDTGKDDYYPIIIPTIINKDTGMLNKTDHFAYVIGYPDGTVHPNGQITRAEVATIFFRLLKDEVRDGAFTTSNSYSDVAYGKWYNNPISTMSALGIITGYPDGTFKPNKPITRAEFAAIAARFDETQSGKSATFSDVIGHWAAKEIGIAYANEWIKGYPDGTFKPDQNITRAEAMTMINRVLERKPESPADLLTNMNKWTDNMDTSKWYYLDVQEATNSHGYTRKTFNYELWRQMLPDPDWSRYER